MHKVLILCTGNSCRSQMAQYLWDRLGEGDWQCFSAGSAPAGYVHEGALAALQELGIDAKDAESKHLDQYTGQDFDLVITVCDNAAESCPVFPGATKVLHWPFMDPADATGSEAEIAECFRTVRNQIQARIELYLRAMQLPQQEQPGDQMLSWMSLQLLQSPLKFSAEELLRYKKLLKSLCNEPKAGPDFLRMLVKKIFLHFGKLGMAWNGIYAQRQSGELELAFAEGPPVCALLDNGGRLGQSGMCLDALSVGHSLQAKDVSSWPGYISCDNESGLKTVSSILCPIRAKDGKVLAVWDVDIQQQLNATDSFFMERLFQSISHFMSWKAEDFQ